MRGKKEWEGATGERTKENVREEEGGIKTTTQIVAYCATVVLVVVVYIAKCVMCNGKQKINTIERWSLSGTVGTMHIQVDT